MNEKLNEALEAVAKINSDLADQYSKIGNDVYRPWSYLTVQVDKDQVLVKWLGRYVWDDDNDPREWREAEIEGEKDTYEPMEPYLRKEVNKVVQELSKIKL